ncbi:putative glutathione-specific gamma-glutamylcyclotransferase 2 [Hylaeus anthracinus]|uniref:putative glutathione-specific gamma-glutamylcyclotransferase 2 n=1 Tax=Hylaeus volcanicus TaxID=313075 RepID=UPI0023B7C27A|nr:putative glutathione-specific gamma-glutamylcyclotransferase 2 [Hylaeus volcanicus]XP_054001892.1 putative glutathione-specific gamma-glutamylcyclotransferase 2 [Hylaeus anthracinus]
MWVFGYGSLVWKADFPYEKTLVGHIKGYVRRFYQKSTDHRGIPSRPGRVVTLLSSENSDDEVWGIAYKISSHDINKVVKHLDYRERGGYERKCVLFYPSYSIENIGSHLLANSASQDNLENAKLLPTTVNDMPFYITIYIGGEDNPNYAGVEDISTIAKQILVSHGPSGANTEYLYKLASAMRIIAPGVYDNHLFTLESAVKALEEEQKTNMKLDQNLCKNKDR